MKENLLLFRIVQRSHYIKKEGISPSRNTKRGFRPFLSYRLMTNRRINAALLDRLWFHLCLPLFSLFPLWQLALEYHHRHPYRPNL